MSRQSPICPVAIRNLAAAFHMRVRRDHLLAPVFARAVGTTDAEWAAHIREIEESWASLMLTDGGRRKSVEARFPDLEPAMFERWLSLLGGTCSDLFEPPVADAFRGHMARIGRPQARG